MKGGFMTKMTELIIFLFMFSTTISVIYMFVAGIF